MSFGGILTTLIYNFAMLVSHVINLFLVRTSACHSFAPSRWTLISKYGFLRFFSSLLRVTANWHFKVNNPLKKQSAFRQTISKVGLIIV